MFILGVGTSPGGKTRVGKSNTMNAGVGGGRPLTSPAPGSVGRRSTISYDQAKTSSSSTERTNEVPRYSGIQLFLFEIYTRVTYYLTLQKYIEYKYKIDKQNLHIYIYINKILDYIFRFYIPYISQFSIRF